MKNTKQFKIIIAMVLALVMALSIIGCAADGDKASTDPSAAPNETEPQPDKAAIAARLGDVTITCGEIEDAYTYYMDAYSQYGDSMLSGMDFDFSPYANVSEAFLQMAIEELVKSNVCTWKAAELNITLSEDEQAMVDAETESYKLELISYYKDAATSKNPSLTAVQAEEEALKAIDAELKSTDESMDLDKFMLMYRDYIVEDELSLKLYDKFEAEHDLTDEDIRSWYETELDRQLADLEEDPLVYRTQLFANEDDPTTAPVLFTPAGWIRIQLIEVVPEGSVNESYNTNKKTMTELEAEYGKLALMGEDAPRRAEIEQKYQTLRTAVDSAWEIYVADARQAATEAMDRLNAGEDFVELMNEYCTNAPTDEMKTTGVLLYTLDKDTNFSDAVYEAAAGLKVGEHSGLVEENGHYYIIRVVAEVEGGEADYDAILPQITAAAKAAIVAQAWESQMEQWSDEAIAKVETFPEAYEYLLNN